MTRQKTNNSALRWLSLAMALTAIAVEAQTVPHVMNVGDFCELKVSSDISVEYRALPDSAGVVVFEAPTDVAAGVVLRNNGKGELSVKLKKEIAARAELPTLRVYSSWLCKVRNEGDSTIRVVSNTHQPKINASLSDNGRIVLEDVDADLLELRIVTGRGTVVARGNCETLNARNLGSGVIQADELIAHEAQCRVVGSGTIGCFVVGGELSVRGAGTGKVYYRGTPSQIIMKKLGTIQAIKIDK